MSATGLLGKTKTPDTNLRPKQHETLEKIQQRVWKVMPQVLRKNLVNPRLLPSNVRLHQHETQEKIHLRAWEGDTMSATDLHGETKTPDQQQLETAGVPRSHWDSSVATLS